MLAHLLPTAYPMARLGCLLYYSAYELSIGELRNLSILSSSPCTVPSGEENLDYPIWYSGPLGDRMST